MDVTFSYFLTIRLQEENLSLDSKTDIFIESETCCGNVLHTKDLQKLNQLNCYRKF